MHNKHSRSRSSSRQSTPRESTVLEQALKICRTRGAGSDEYFNFLRKMESEHIPAGVHLPRFVPGDVREAGANSFRGKGKKARSRRREGGVLKPERASTGAMLGVKKRLSAFEEPCEVQGTGKENVPTDVFGQPEDAVSSPTGCSSAATDVTAVLMHSDSIKSDGLRMMDAEMGLGFHQRTLSCASVPETEMRRMQQVLDEHKQKSTKLEMSLAQAKKRNESLYRFLRRVRNQNSEQDMIMLQVTGQLQELLGEKERLKDENYRLRNENDNLKELLAFASVESESGDEEADDLVLAKEILAWHPPQDGDSVGSVSPTSGRFGNESEFEVVSNGGMAAQGPTELVGKLEKFAISS